MHKRTSARERASFFEEDAAEKQIRREGAFLCPGFGTVELVPKSAENMKAAKMFDDRNFGY